MRSRIRTMYSCVIAYSECVVLVTIRYGTLSQGSLGRPSEESLSPQTSIPLRASDVGMRESVQSASTEFQCCR
jgi:hypothetical protein